MEIAERLAEAIAPPAEADVLLSSRDAPAYGPRLREAPSRGFIAKGELS